MEALRGFDQLAIGARRNLNATGLGGPCRGPSLAGLPHKVEKVPTDSVNNFCCTCNRPSGKRILNTMLFNSAQKATKESLW